MCGFCREREIEQSSRETYIARRVNLRTESCQKQTRDGRLREAPATTGEISSAFPITHTLTFGRLFGTSQIGRARVVGDVSNLLNKLIRGRVVSAVTASRFFGTAVENVLNREIAVGIER